MKTESLNLKERMSVLARGGVLKWKTKATDDHYFTPYSFDDFNQLPDIITNDDLIWQEKSKVVKVLGHELENCPEPYKGVYRHKDTGHNVYVIDILKATAVWSNSYFDSEINYLATKNLVYKTKKDAEKVLELLRAKGGVRWKLS